MNKIILYYTCNTHDPAIDERCRDQLSRSDLPILSVSLNQPLAFGQWRVTLEGKRSPLTMHKQVTCGLNYIAEIAQDACVFLCESDVLYHPSHFDFTPVRRDTFYFNTNVYKRWPDGLTVWTDALQQISGVCAERTLLFEFFRRRVDQIERDGFNRHYEPHARYGCRTDDWQSPIPNLDLRHEHTLTQSHRSKESFRNQKFAQGFRVVEHVPFWDDPKEMEIV